MFEDIEDIFDCHPTWKALAHLDKHLLLDEAEQCVIDGCMSDEDFMLIKEYLREISKNT